MKVQNKKSEVISYPTTEQWKEWKDIDGWNMQKSFKVLSKEDISAKQEHVPIKIQPLLGTEVIEIILEPIEVAVEKDATAILKYSLPVIENFLKENDIEDYREILLNDPRKGMIKILE